MILILSKSKHESTTEDVMEWISFFGYPCKRINGADIEIDSSVFVNIKTNQSEIKKIELNSKNFPVIWFRRWKDNTSFSDTFSNINFDNIKNKNEIQEYLEHESYILKEFLFNKLKKSHWLGSPDKTNVNKLIVLDYAKKVGLNIPDTFIISEKLTLIEILKKHKTLITKPISESPHFFSEKNIYSLYTENVCIDHIDNNTPDNFLPTLFQENIKKAYELRIFYLDGDFYSMAIFSQNNNKTSTDFRKYDNDKPNRMIPFNIDINLKEKLSNLMNKIGLKSGSIDCIVEIDSKKIFFLEVNPVGQFGMVSSNCNYYLEKKIALYLIKKHGKN